MMRPLRISPRFSQRTCLRYCMLSASPHSLPDICECIYRSSSAREQLRQCIHEPSVETALRHLTEFAQDRHSADSFSADSFSAAPGDIQCRVDLALRSFERWYVARKAPAKVTMHEPWNWYPRARFMRRRFIFHHGPTNSGKTHAALEALLSARSGVYCAPLKALAAQVWRRVDAAVPCDLLIGDERRFAGGAEHVACTIEMAPLDLQVDVAVLDEVQMIADRDRGWAWTRALLGLPAREVHLCGESRALQVVRDVLYRTKELPRLSVVPHRRLVPLELCPPLGGDLSAVENGDCIVAFSRRAVFDLRRRLHNVPGVEVHCVYGAMPFAVREAQVAAFNDGVAAHNNNNSSGGSSSTTKTKTKTTRHVLVSTDAIAYGLNMSIERVVFSTMAKFDGRGVVPLPAASVAQIAGRAGRFGVASRVRPMGRCTTLHSGGDFEALRSAMGERLAPIERAGLLPTADILELYMQLSSEKKGLDDGGGEEEKEIGKGGGQCVSFAERVSQFTNECRATDVFVPCDMTRSLLQVARALESVPELALADRILFCYVPLNERNSETFALLCAFAADHAAGQNVALRIDVNFENVAKEWQKAKGNKREAQRLLSRIEQIYRQAEMYCWLSWRFGKTFVHLEAGTALKERAAAMMIEIMDAL